MTPPDFVFCFLLFYFIFFVFSQECKVEKSEDKDNIKSNIKLVGNKFVSLITYLLLQLRPDKQQLSFN